VDCSAAFAANTALLGQDKEAGTTGIQSLHRSGLRSATSKSNIHEINPEWQIKAARTSASRASPLRKELLHLYHTGLEFTKPKLQNV